MIKSMGSDPETAAMAPQTILKMQKEYLYSTTYELLGYLNIKKGVEGNDCLCVLLFLYLAHWKTSLFGAKYTGNFAAEF